MNVTVINRQSVKEWLEQRIELNHDVRSLKSHPPEKMRYRYLGAPISQPLCVAWVDCVTGEMIPIRYQGWTDNGHIVTTRDNQNEIVSITLQNDQGDIQSVIWEKDID